MLYYKKPFNFNADLAADAKTQRLLAPQIASFIGASGIAYSQGKNSDYDFSMIRNNRPITYELKTDLRAEYTGNVFIETGCNGHDSGITVTKANSFLVYLPHLEVVLSHPPERVKGMIEHFLSIGKARGGIKAGDGDRALGVLLSIRDYSTQSKQLHINN